MEKSTQSRNGSEHNNVKTGASTCSIKMERDIAPGERIRPTSVHRSSSLKSAQL